MTNPATKQNHIPGHEPDAVSIPAVAAAAITLAALIALALLIAAGVMFWTDGFSPTTASSQSALASFSSPGVRANQAYTRAELRESERFRLQDYRWLDSERTHARIPIERAMELLAAHEMTVDWHAPVTAPKPESP